MSKNNMKQLEDEFEMKPEYDFSKGVRGRFYSPHKRPTTIRLDDDIILYFKKTEKIKHSGMSHENWSNKLWRFLSFASLPYQTNSFKIRPAIEMPKMI